MTRKLILYLWPRTVNTRLDRLQLFWEHSPLWLLPVFILSFFAARLFYPPDGQWDKLIRTSLLSIRTLLLFLVLSLLLNPLIRRFKQTLMPPVAVVLIDDSQSVAMGTSPDSLSLFRKNLKSLVTSLSKEELKVEVMGLRKTISSDSAFPFSQRETNLHQALQKVEEEFDNQNVSEIILASDGIINQGSDPGQVPHSIPINTILLGNPQVRKDLSITQVQNNKIAFLGNTFPVRVQVRGSRLEGITAIVSISDGANVLENKTIKIGPSGLAEVEFALKATGKGLKIFQVEVKPVAGELTVLNNSRKVYVEVIDGKQKILLAASAPHPDIKAILDGLESLDNLEVETVIGGLDSWKTGHYDLVILHQLPDRFGTYGSQVSALLKSNTATLQFCGMATDFNRLRNEASGWLTIQGFGNGMEEMNGEFNLDFQRFGYEDKWKKTIEELPPILSPVASFSFKSPFEVIMKQKLGKASTNTPLLAMASGLSPKRGIFWGEGIWLWRQNEYAQNQKFEAVDNLLQKTVQYLVTSDKKQRLKCYLTQNELFEGEQGTFQIETYNPLFEPIYSQKINLELLRSDGKRFNYSFFNSQGNSSFLTESLAEGSYKFVASATLNGKLEKDHGEFVVRANQLEVADLQANHNLLKQLAAQTGGRSVGLGQMLSLIPSGENIPKPLVEFTDWDESILSQWWILLLIIGLATTEWIIRKWNGNL